MRAFFRSLRPTINPAGWIAASRQMRSLLQSLAADPRTSAGSTQHFAVVLTPWLATAVPWFSLASGALLAKVGVNVTFVIDDMPFGDQPWRSRFIVSCVRRALAGTSFERSVVSLSDYRAQVSSNDDAARQAVERLALLNATWRMRGETAQVGRGNYTKLIAAQMSATYPAVKCLLARHRFDVLLVPGGVYGSSGIWVEHARGCGVRLVTYDGGTAGTLLWASNGIACQLQDIPRAFHALKHGGIPADELEFIAQAARDEMAKRRAGTDSFTYQAAREGLSDNRYHSGVLVALNSSWDSAALGLHGAFGSSSDWILATVKHILDSTNLPVIVRQHPVERLQIAHTTDDYGSMLSQAIGSHPRLHFIGASDSINTYELLEQVSIVAVHTSTIGIEAAAEGKVVITSSNPYYADLGFVLKAESPDRYRHYLSEAAAGRCHVTESQRADALLCYYLTQCCNWIFSPFNPGEFRDWNKLGGRGLLEHEMVRMILQSTEENIPVATINHRRLRTTAGTRAPR